MNAVNLIPADSRGKRASLSASRPTLALIGGLVVVLIAAVMYVSAANQVTTRTTELARVKASAAGWSVAANSYATFVQAAQQRTQALADVRQLAAGRFPWSNLLSQIGGLMPAAAALNTLQATTTPSTAATTPGTTATTPGTTATTPGTTATTPSTISAAPLPAVQLTGCAVSQSTVAQTMVQLHRVAGVIAVTLSSSNDNGATATGSGGCPYPVQFQIALTFGTTAPTTASGASTTSPATASSGAATPPAATTTTGAVQ
jgi:Tfp pilus assembly protein PilN